MVDPRQMLIAASVILPTTTLAFLFRYDIVDTPYGYIKHDRWTGSIATCRQTHVVGDVKIVRHEKNQPPKTALRDKLESYHVVTSDRRLITKCT